MSRHHLQTVRMVDEDESYISAPSGYFVLHYFHHSGKVMLWIEFVGEHDINDFISDTRCNGVLSFSPLASGPLQVDWCWGKLLGCTREEQVREFFGLLWENH